MLLYEIVNMAVDSCYECYLWDNDMEENVFEGAINEIPGEFLDYELTSWEIDKGKIGFNIQL